MAETSTSDLVGQTMVNIRGEKVGKIDEVLTLEASGEARWACVKYGPLGMRCTYVPLHHAVEEKGHVRVPYETEHIRQTPDVEAEDGRIVGEAGDLLHRHYGLDPLATPAREIDDDTLELPREPRQAVPPAMEEGPDSPLAQRRRERARELGVPEHD